MELDDDAAPPLAVANYGALPTDVLYDILLRLPADDVCLLRLVCRSWRSLMSDPLFARAHLTRHPHVVVLHHSSHEVHVVDLHGRIIKRVSTGHPGEGLRMTHGDLHCISHGWGLAYVLNLVTGDVVADITTENRRKVNSEKPTCVFGRVPSTGEYKVLRIQSILRSYNNNGSFFTSSQTCEVMTLGRSRRWRKGPRPPVIVSSSLLSPWSMAVVDGVAYFLLRPEEVAEQPDSIAVFDMATEEWKPTTLQGPLSSLLGSTDEELVMYPIRRKHFQLARLSERLVTVYCNLQGCSTELWFLVDMEESIWTKQYTLQGTPFGDDFTLHYHYPLAVLDDGRIVVWVYRSTGALRAYDPRTSTWADLTTVKGHVGMHHGSLLCPDLGVEP